MVEHITWLAEDQSLASPSKGSWGASVGKAKHRRKRLPVGSTLNASVSLMHMFKRSLCSRTLNVFLTLHVSQFFSLLQLIWHSFWLTPVLQKCVGSEVQQGEGCFPNAIFSAPSFSLTKKSHGRGEGNMANHFFHLQFFCSRVPSPPSPAVVIWRKRKELSVPSSPTASLTCWAEL